jgi:hypothetical protein
MIGKSHILRRFFSFFLICLTTCYQTSGILDQNLYVLAINSSWILLAEFQSTQGHGLTEAELEFPESLRKSLEKAIDTKKKRLLSRKGSSL